MLKSILNLYNLYLKGRKHEGAIPSFSISVHWNIYGEINKSKGLLYMAKDTIEVANDFSIDTVLQNHTDTFITDVELDDLRFNKPYPSVKEYLDFVIEEKTIPTTDAYALKVDTPVNLLKYLDFIEYIRDNAETRINLNLLIAPILTALKPIFTLLGALESISILQERTYRDLDTQITDILIKLKTIFDKCDDAKDCIVTDCFGTRDIIEKDIQAYISVISDIEEWRRRISLIDNTGILKLLKEGTINTETQELIDQLEAILVIETVEDEDAVLDIEGFENYLISRFLEIEAIYVYIARGLGDIPESDGSQKTYDEKLAEVDYIDNKKAEFESYHADYLMYTEEYYNWCVGVGASYGTWSLRTEDDFFEKDEDGNVTAVPLNEFEGEMIGTYDANRVLEYADNFPSYVDQRPNTFLQRIKSETVPDLDLTDIIKNVSSGYDDCLNATNDDGVDPAKNNRITKKCNILSDIRMELGVMHLKAVERLEGLMTFPLTEDYFNVL